MSMTKNQETKLLVRGALESVEKDAYGEDKILVR